MAIRKFTFTVVMQRAHAAQTFDKGLALHY
jgi:hypothetical protein